MTVKNIVGFIRFSFVALQRQEWRQTSGKSPEEIASILYQSDRMESRFKHFEKVCLPSISLLNHPNSWVIILVSDLMPDIYMEKLRKLVAPYDHITLYSTPPQELNKTCLDAIRQYSLDKCDSIITYRLDDDDAVFRGFDRYLLHNYGNREFHGVIVTLPEGFEVQYRDGHIYGGYRRFPAIGAGLAFVEAPENMIGIFSTGNHTTISKRYPLILDPRRKGWLRVKHDTNDSDEGHVIETVLTRESFGEQMEKLFPYWKNVFDIK